MNDQDIDRRLNAADPASPEPAGLSLVIDTLVAEPVGRSRQRLSRRWRPALITGGVLALAGGLVAAANIDTILLSIPPFSTLSAGESRVVDGLPYSPLEDRTAESDASCTSTSLASPVLSSRRRVAIGLLWSRLHSRPRSRSS